MTITSRYRRKEIDDIGSEFWLLIDENKVKVNNKPMLVMLVYDIEDVGRLGGGTIP